MIFITHDMGVVAEIADRVLVMRRGEQVEQNRVRELFAAPQQAYTRALLAAVPKLGRWPIGRCRRSFRWRMARGYGAAGYRAARRCADPAGGASGHAF